nr:hypothetical protein [Tanacetum cinerariifolium]
MAEYFNCIQNHPEHELLNEQWLLGIDGGRSWERYGGGGVECRVRKCGEWGWREFWVGGMNSTYFKKRGKMVLCRFWCFDM